MIAASMTPTTVISVPLAHHDLRRDQRLRRADDEVRERADDERAMTAGMPTVKKNGMIGMKPPMAVETVAESVERQRVGKGLLAMSPSSSWTSVRRNCFGSFCSRSAIDRASSAEKPLSW